MKNCQSAVAPTPSGFGRRLSIITVSFIAVLTFSACSAAGGDDPINTNPNPDPRSELKIVTVSGAFIETGSSPEEVKAKIAEENEALVILNFGNSPLLNRFTEADFDVSISPPGVGADGGLSKVIGKDGGPVHTQYKLKIKRLPAPENSETPPLLYILNGGADDWIDEGAGVRITVTLRKDGYNLLYPTQRVIFSNAPAPATVITDFDLTDKVPKPVSGEAVPGSPFTGGQYTVSAEWSPVPEGGVFQTGALYTATVTLSAAEGCIFPTPPVQVFHSGAQSFTYNFAGNLSGVSGAIGFPLTTASYGDPIEISGELDLTGIAPAAGAIPATSFNDTANDAASLYTVAVAWYEVSDSGSPVSNSSGFAAGRKYRADVTLTANTGYVFADSLPVKHDGIGYGETTLSPSTISGGTTATVTINFPYISQTYDLPFSGDSTPNNMDSAIDLIRAAKTAGVSSLTLNLAARADETVNMASGDISGGLSLNTATSPANVTIDGGGRVIDLTGPTGNTAPLITVGSGVKLTLRNITFDGIKGDLNNDSETNMAPLIKVLTGGELVLDTGAVLTGNENHGSNGGGVNVEGGVLTMKAGAVISDNYGDAGVKISGGGGVYVASGIFNMEGGSIVRNGGTQGGGVHMTGGVFNMSGGVIGGSVADKNYSLWAAGGGVDVRNGGEFIMSGNAEISYNTADYAGGGVHLDSAADSAATPKFTMSGNAEISYNTGGWNGGGGVALFSGEFTMNGGAISGNSAASDSGGVGAWSSSKFTMNGGTISGNSAPKGGGVGVGAKATFTKSGSGGTIYGTTSDALKNTATTNNNGHAVFWATGAKKRNSTVGPTDSMDIVKGSSTIHDGFWD